MAMIFHNGFEAAGSAAGQSGQTLLNRLGFTGTTTCTTQTGRTGTGLSLFNTKPVYPLSSPKTALVVGLGVRRDTQADTRQFVALKLGASYQMCVTADATGAVQVRRGGPTGAVLAAAPAGTILSGAWSYFELKAAIDPAAGSFELRKDGATLLTGSGVNTQAQGSANVDGIELVDGSNLYVDDFYVLDLTGSAPQNDFLGPVQSEARFPIADGTTDQWTPSAGTDHFAVIDESPANDDTDYLSAAATGLLDLCSCQSVGSSDVILSVIQLVEARKTDPGVAQLTPTLRIGATNYPGSTQPIADTYTIISQLHQNSPATGVQWTAAEVNGAQLVGFASA